MTPDEPTWDETGFDPEPGSGEGFLPSEPETRRRVEGPTASQATPPPPPTKRRSALFWFGTLAAVVLLIALIGGGIYWMSLPSAEEEAFYAKEASVPNVAVDSAAQTPDANEVAVVDTNIVHDPEALEALFGNEDSTATAQIEAPPKPEPAVEPQVQPKALTKTQPKSQPKAQPIAATPALSKPKAPVTKEPAAPLKTKPATKSGAMYVVQVFSSPSRDDADEWLQSLRTKRVAEAYVTEQKIKGESWYRVRFGQFSTREEAEAEALRLGFREPWVARIR